MVLGKISACAVAVVMFLGNFTSEARAQWHRWTQGQRNSVIVNRALQQNGYYTGQQCKEWVQNTVYNASTGVVWLPQNQPNLYQWYWSSDAYAVPYSPSIYSANSGSVIQMKWNGTPHTAIVYSSSGSGMWWIDCNWNGDRRVTMHFVSYNQFAAACGNLYTVYYVK
mgnify:CR=1 FL=1